MFRLLKKANFADDLGPGYENAYGQVTPFHVLFKDFGSQIAELPKDQAVEYCINKIRDLNNKHNGDPGYAEVSEVELKDIKEQLLSESNENGMDVLFAVKDMLLATEGVGEEPEEGAPPQMEEQQEVQDTTQEPIQEEVQPDIAPEPVVEEQPAQTANFKRLMKKRG